MVDRQLLLDTCALIWLVQGGGTLSDAALQRIRFADTVLVSPISIWEISLKVERQQLVLPLETLEWYRQVLVHHHLKQISLSAEILIRANQLPWHHKDPVDRFIVASAQREKAAIVTGDQKFRQYDIEVVS